MDKENFKDLVSMAIFALAEEKVGGQEYAREYWERIRNASDVFISVMETNEPDGIFHTNYEQGQGAAE